jgi:hypothetical protein
VAGVLSAMTAEVSDDAIGRERDVGILPIEARRFSEEVDPPVTLPLRVRFELVLELEDWRNMNEEGGAPPFSLACWRSNALRLARGAVAGGFVDATSMVDVRL